MLRAVRDVAGPWRTNFPEASSRFRIGAYTTPNHGADSRFNSVGERRMQIAT